jgi:hypothetical protein
MSWNFTLIGRSAGLLDDESVCAKAGLTAIAAVNVANIKDFMGRFPQFDQSSLGQHFMG